MAARQKLQVEGELKVLETTGMWGVYAGERILVGPGDSYRDDLGVMIREVFQAGAREALAAGHQSADTFELQRIRVTVERLDPEPPRGRGGLAFIRDRLRRSRL